jgi:hypothetical protein
MGGISQAVLVIVGRRERPLDWWMVCHVCRSEQGRATWDAMRDEEKMEELHEDENGTQR